MLVSAASPGDPHLWLSQYLLQRAAQPYTIVDGDGNPVSLQSPAMMPAAATGAGDAADGKAPEPEEQGVGSAGAGAGVDGRSTHSAPDDASVKGQAGGAADDADDPDSKHSGEDAAAPDAGGDSGEDSDGAGVVRGVSRGMKVCT